MSGATKRFFVFGGAQYYPSGGAGDFMGAFRTLPEATAFVDECIRKTKHDLDWIGVEEWDGETFVTIEGVGR